MRMEFRNQLAVWRGFLRILAYRSFLDACLPPNHTHYKPVPMWSVAMEGPSVITRNGVRKRKEMCCISQVTQDIWGGMKTGGVTSLALLATEG